jgi:hypothetical protein
VDEEAVLAFLSDGRRLTNDSIRDLAGAEDQVCLFLLSIEWLPWIPWTLCLLWLAVTSHGIKWGFGYIPMDTFEHQLHYLELSNSCDCSQSSCSTNIIWMPTWTMY